MLSCLNFSVFASGPTPTDALTLAWDPSIDPTVVGYRLYQGTTSQVYTSVTDIGNQTSANISALAGGRTYYFAVTAYDATGLESAFSGEISYTVPTSAPRPPYLQVTATITQDANKQLVLAGTAPIGSICRILATQDFSTWSLVDTVTVDAQGFFQVTDPASGLLSHRFYRMLLDTAPPLAPRIGSDLNRTAPARTRSL
jgi:hypothetical protein